MAELIGKISIGHVRKLAYGERVPSLAVASRIKTVTDGAVSHDDFVAPSPPPIPASSNTEHAA